MTKLGYEKNEIIIIIIIIIIITKKWSFTRTAKVLQKTLYGKRNKHNI